MKPLDAALTEHISQATNQKKLSPFSMKTATNTTREGEVNTVTPEIMGPAADAAVIDDQSDLKQMLRGIANGDRASFATFHERFTGMVYATAIQVLHNHEDAEDCTQEVFASLWSKAGMYLDDRGKPSTWLAAMARNRAIDKLRARQRRSRLNDSFEDECRIDEPVTRIDPSKQAGVSELTGHVRSAVMQLSPEQSEAIRMAFFEGLTQLEISRKTGEPLGTIKARIRRGLGRLRTLIKE